MAAATTLNPKAEVAKRGQALQININSALGLQDVLKTNLGPTGTMKMLVSGSGEIKLSKDGKVLLNEMQIQNPVASMIARAASAQDDITGDGTTSNVLLIAELLKQAERFISEGAHPRVITTGYDLAKEESLKFLDQFKKTPKIDRELLVQIAKTSLRTKLHHALADQLTENIVDSVLAIQKEGERIDLHMIEIQKMMHKTDMDTTLVKGLVMDHGTRHPDMPKRVEKPYILICNISLEYEKTEVNSVIEYRSAEERDKMVAEERKFIDDRVKKIIKLKYEVCDGNNRGFVIINQKGIDPLSLDMLAKAGISALRRAKRRNMERLQLACGGSAINSLDNITKDVLGEADLFYEHVLGEEKFTFLEVANPRSVSLLLKGPNKHTLTQIHDAVRDGLRAVKNAIEDESVLVGAGAFEVALKTHLIKYSSTVKDQSRMGVVAFANAFLIIPKVLAQNSGLDKQETIALLEQEHEQGNIVGLDLSTGECNNPEIEGIWDNYRVKRQLLHSCSVIANNILLVDEMMRIGKSSLKQDQ